MVLVAFPSSRAPLHARFLSERLVSRASELLDLGWAFEGVRLRCCEHLCVWLQCRSGLVPESGGITGKQPPPRQAADGVPVTPVLNSSPSSSNPSPLTCMVSGGLACASQVTPGVEHRFCTCGPGHAHVVLGPPSSTFLPSFHCGFVPILFASPWSLLLERETPSQTIAF